MLGEANCIFSLGDIVLARSDDAAARLAYEATLALYRSIQEPYSIGRTHRRLARLASGDDRTAHVKAARDAWISIDRPDSVAELSEFD